jgi:hypothetical protein
MNKKMVNHPMFNEPCEITHALVSVASQENCDDPDIDLYDLMIDAAHRIRHLEAMVDLLTPLAKCGRMSLNDHLINSMNQYFKTNHKNMSPEFVKIVEENFWELLA